jgi:ribosomal protein S6
MKKVCNEIVTNQGIVRSIQNHGIRDLPHRFQARYADRQGVRYYPKGRFVSIYYDSNPATMRMVEQVLTLNEEVLRHTHLKARSILDFVNTEQEHKNFFVKQVRKEQAKERAAKKHVHETVEQIIDDMRVDNP